MLRQPGWTNCAQACEASMATPHPAISVRASPEILRLAAPSRWKMGPRPCMPQVMARVLVRFSRWQLVAWNDPGGLQMSVESQSDGLPMFFLLMGYGLFGFGSPQSRRRIGHRRRLESFRNPFPPGLTRTCTGAAGCGGQTWRAAIIRRPQQTARASVHLGFQVFSDRGVRRPLHRAHRKARVGRRNPASTP